MCHESCPCLHPANKGTVFHPHSINKTDPDPITAHLARLDELAAKAAGDL